VLPIYLFYRKKFKKREPDVQSNSSGPSLVHLLLISWPREIRNQKLERLNENKLSGKECFTMNTSAVGVNLGYVLVYRYRNLI
jgi:hypothetical protein